MILVANDVHPRRQPVAHIQHVLDVKDWKSRGRAICGIEMLPPNFTWSPIPVPEKALTMMTDQNWSVCLDCVLGLLELPDGVR